MRKIRESMKLVVLLAGAGGLIALGCSSDSKGPGGPINTAGSGPAGGAGGGIGFGNPDAGTMMGGGMGGGLSLGNKDGGTSQGGFGGLTFGGRGGTPGTGGATGGSGPGGSPGTGGAPGTGGSPGTGGAIGTTVAIGDYPAAFAQTICTRLGECCTGGIDVNGCIQSIQSNIQMITGSYAPSISAGRVAYRGEKVATCLNRLRMEACGTFRTGSTSANIFQDCDAAFEARVAIGGACEDSAECAGGWCAAQGMTCRATFGPGAQCLDDAHCASDNCDQAAMTCGPAQMITPMICPGMPMPPGPMP